MASERETMPPSDSLLWQFFSLRVVTSDPRSQDVVTLLDSPIRTARTLSFFPSC